VRLERLRAFLQQAETKPEVRAALKGAVRVRVHRAWYSVVPEDWRKPPVRQELLGEIRLADRL
jgi:hypothetical protein